MNEGTFPDRYQGLYMFLALLFSVIIIVSNIVTVKLVSLPFFFGLAVPCGLVTYPLTFLIGDLLTEIYGIKKARFVVYMGFCMSFVSLAIIQFALALPAHPDWVAFHNLYGYQRTEEYQRAFSSVFGINGIALTSSMLAYAASQLMDIRLFAFIRELTDSKHLWLRNSGSTLASQVIDTLIVNTLVLHCGLKLDLDVVIKISFFCYLYKVFFTCLSIPLFYALVKGAKRFLGTDWTPSLEFS